MVKKNYKQPVVVAAGEASGVVPAALAAVTAAKVIGAGIAAVGGYAVGRSIAHAVEIRMDEPWLRALKKVDA